MNQITTVYAALQKKKFNLSQSISRYLKYILVLMTLKTYTYYLTYTPRNVWILYKYINTRMKQ